MINTKKIALLCNIPLIINFITYSFGTILIRGISFFIVPLVMYKIPPSHYGIFSLLTTFITITTAILGLGLRQLLSIEYFHANQEQRHWLMQDIIIIYTVIAVPFIFFLWQLRSSIMHTLFFNTITSFEFCGALISIFFFFYNELLYQLLQYEQAIKYLISLQFFAALCIAGMTLFTVFYLELGITGIIWSQTIGMGTIASIAFTFLRTKQLSFTAIRFMPISYYIWHGLPFIPGILAHWIIASSNRWILGYFTTMHQVGIYAVADLASQLFYLVILQSWAACYLPYIMRQYQQHPDTIATIETKNHRIMWITLIGLAIIITIGYPIASLIITKIIPPSYGNALHYAWILLMGQLCLLGTYFAAALIQYAKRTYFLASALCIPACINIILNCLLIPYAGIRGCALATLLSYAIYFAIIYWYNKKLLRTIYFCGVSNSVNN